MATRALIGTIETDAAGNQVLTSTYNHYDGYPENLGVGLNNFYDQTDAAIKISNQGYISYLNPETGEIEAKHKDPADKTVLPDNYEDAMRKIYSTADSYGADYLYLYDFDDADWVFSTMMGSQKVIDTFSGTGIENQFEGYEGGDMADYDSIDNMEEGYKIKWKKFIAENDDATVRFEKIRDNAYRMLKSEDGNQVNDYVDALERQIKLKPSDADEYIEYDRTDWKADFDDYVSDKMDF